MTIAELFSLLTPIEFEAFAISLGSLIENYRKTSELTIEQLIPILGKPPIISDSPDMDTMMYAFDARALYGKKAASIEQYLNEKVIA